MDDCVFCNIVNRTINSDILFEDDKVIVVRDIMPKAPVHVLVITKAHIASINEITEKDGTLAGDMILVARDIASKLGVKDSGYKLVFNVGTDGGQTIKHLHLHVLGGKRLSE